MAGTKAGEESMPASIIRAVLMVTLARRAWVAAIVGEAQAVQGEDTAGTNSPRKLRMLHRFVPEPVNPRPPLHRS